MCPCACVPLWFAYNSNRYIKQCNKFLFFVQEKHVLNIKVYAIDFVVGWSKIVMPKQCRPEFHIARPFLHRLLI